MFDFVENFEHEVAAYIEKYNKMAWADTKAKNVDPSLLSDDEEKIWGWMGRYYQRELLVKKLMECSNRLDRIEKETVLFDKIDKQRQKLCQIDKILYNIDHDLPKGTPLCRRLTLDQFSRDVDFKQIPIIEKAVRGASPQWILAEAMSWAKKENAPDEKRDIAALRWLTNKELLGANILTNLGAIRLLQQEWQVHLGWQTDGTAERKALELKAKYKDTIPDSPPI